MPSSASLPGQAINITVDTALLATAKALRINISQASQDGLQRAVALRQAPLWVQANQGALDSCNAHVDQQGLPLARFRNF